MHRIASKGATLIDTVVATGLIVLVFVGISAAFQLSVDVVTNNKARAGALALATERIEYIRSLGYDAVGTSGGIPAGGILQSEQVLLNGITYTRRTLILYADDPKDGLGGADTNGVTADYKAVKVEVSWTAKNGSARSVSLVTRISPITIEQAVPGGTLSLAIIGASTQPIVGAQVSVINTNIAPPINMTLFSDENGMVTVLGAPPSAGYEIVVSKSGHSVARTYPATTENTNPSPGHLTVALNQTTSATFAIDLVATKNIRSYTPVETRTIADTFTNDSGLASSINTVVSGDSLRLSGNPGEYAGFGEARSVAIATSTPITAWREAVWDDVRPAQTNIVYRVYSGDGTALIPDAQIAGNSTGFTVPPIDLSLVSTSTYQALSLHVTLGSADPNETPEVASWALSFDTGPIPLPNLTFSVRGAKTIGSGPSGQIFTYSTTSSTGAAAGVNLANLEWDTYTVLVSAATGYDVSSSCTPQPQSLAPGEYQTTELIVEPHTTHSLLVDVRNGAGVLIPTASVRLFRGGYDQTRATNSCGQTFFGGLTEGTQGGGNPFSISVSASGYSTYTATDVSISGTTRLSVILN